MPLSTFGGSNALAPTNQYSTYGYLQRWPFLFCSRAGVSKTFEEEQYSGTNNDPASNHCYQSTKIAF